MNSGAVLFGDLLSTKWCVVKVMFQIFAADDRIRVSSTPALYMGLRSTVSVQMAGT
jgi:hypothetical protein